MIKSYKLKIKICESPIMKERFFGLEPPILNF